MGPQFTGVVAVVVVGVVGGQNREKKIGLKSNIVLTTFQKIIQIAHTGGLKRKKFVIDNNSSMI